MVWALSVVVFLLVIGMIALGRILEKTLQIVAKADKRQADLEAGLGIHAEVIRSLCQNAIVVGTRIRQTDERLDVLAEAVLSDVDETFIN